MDVAFFAEEISAIGALNGTLIEKKEQLRLLNLGIHISQRTMTSSEEELAKYTGYRNRCKPCTPVEEAALRSALADLEGQLSALKRFDLKKRKELKEKIETLKDQQQKASGYLYYCDQIATAEKNIADARQKYHAGVANKEPMTKEIQLLEQEIARRVDAVLSAMKKAKTNVAELAKALTCPPSVLPGSLQKVLITDAASPLLAGLPIDKQVKLLWDRDIPLRFGGMEWNVVEIEKNRARLILRGTVYDGIGFSEAKNGGWDNSYGRKKLNGEFLDRFTPEEKNFIIPNDKSFGDRFTILSKQELDLYLGIEQRNLPTNWWTSSSYIDTYSDEKERCVYYWDSFYEESYKRYSDALSTAYSISVYGGKHKIGYRPLVLVKLHDDPNDIAWADLWQSTAVPSIICRDKWTSSNNYTPPYVRFSVSDVQRIAQTLGGNSTTQTNWRDNFNSNGTPSGHGGHYK